VIYEGKIIDTPLLEDKTIDVDELTAFFKKEYGMQESPLMIFTRAR